MGALRLLSTRLQSPDLWEVLVFDMEKMTTAELVEFLARKYTSMMERSLQESARKELARRREAERKG